MPIKAESAGSAKSKAKAASAPSKSEKVTKAKTETVAKASSSDVTAAAAASGAKNSKKPLKWFDSSYIPHHPLDLVKFLMTPPEREHGEVIRCYIVREPSMIMWECGYSRSWLGIRIFPLLRDILT